MSCREKRRDRRAGKAIKNGEKQWFWIGALSCECVWFSCLRLQNYFAILWVFLAVGFNPTQPKYRKTWVKMCARGTLQGLGLVNKMRTSFITSCMVIWQQLVLIELRWMLYVFWRHWFELTRQYHQALDASVARTFHDNECIACMSHNTGASCFVLVSFLFFCNFGFW